MQYHNSACNELPSGQGSQECAKVEVNDKHEFVGVNLSKRIKIEDECID